MSIRNLVIFTERFPYYGGEQFLELEIEYLANKFEKIILVPRIASGNVRKLPQNVFISSFSPRLSLYEILSAIFDKNFILEAVKHWKAVSSPKGAYRLFNFTVYGKRIQRWIGRLSPEIVNSAYFYSYWMSHAAIGVAWAKKSEPKLSFITRGHGWDVYSHIHNPPYLPFRSLIFDSADRIYPISQAGLNYICERNFVLPDKIKVARLGVAKSRHLTKRSDDGVFRIVSCSSMITLKRIEIIIRIISQLSQRREFSKKIIWTHFGDGPLHDELVSLANRLFTNQIECVFTGNVKNAEVLKFYTENPVDIFINTSSSEGIPVSIMEAQAFGIPVMATNVGGVSEIVDENNGFLLDIDFEIEEAVQNFIKISSDSFLMDNLRRGSFAMWASHYDAANNYEDFYHDIVSLVT
ncbi:glycosyltransferase [Deinococcus sp. AJ005]|uniref:glycosyltransferase n=1 Tax=Deinococcus sp. AJ005 TaxID=2652443 RepID=UPI00125CC6F6|nr:glycosyltransferase [Deinococcus sp. AJ005]QFP75890.1 glycosyltransferase [Deinococcus sp. AJ005]